MFSCTSKYYRPLGGRVQKKTGDYFYTMIAVDGSHVVDMTEGKYCILELGVTFLYRDRHWELTRYSKRRCLEPEIVDKILLSLNQATPGALDAFQNALVSAESVDHTELQCACSPTAQ